jgi:hypothetical protein
MNYLDVKTKSINWCEKMLKVGLLNTEQYNQCVSNFKDISSGMLQDKFKPPKTGVDHEYSLYNTRASKLSSNITGDSDNTNNVMLGTFLGTTLACKDDNTLYTVTNINDPTVIQFELYFTLIPQNENNYSILSPYGKYLIIGINTDQKIIDTQGPYNVAFTGSSVGPMSTWLVNKVDEAGTDKSLPTTKITLESFQFPGFYLAFDQNSNTITILNGQNDSMKWLMMPKKEQRLDIDQTNYSGFEYIASRDKTINEMKNINTQLICLNIMLDVYKKYADKISNNYNDIVNYVSKTLTNNQRLYQMSTDKQYKQLDSGVPAGLLTPISGSNLSNDEIAVALNKINNMRNAFLQNFNTSVIVPLEARIKELETSGVGKIFDNYMESLDNDIVKLTQKIEQNNEIMARQKNDYNTMNNELSSSSQKMNKIKEFQEVSDLNINLLSSYTNQTSLLNKIYPFGILILGMAIVYLIYKIIDQYRLNY